MEQVETIFHLDSVDVENIGKRATVTALAREVNESTSGQLHPQPVHLTFDVPSHKTGATFCDLKGLQVDLHEIRCVGAFTDANEKTAELYDYFIVQGYEVAHDYDGQEEERAVTDQPDIAEDGDVEVIHYEESDILAPEA